MPPKKSAPSTPLSAPRKVSAAVKSYIEDAPLFAGLDDYILKQTATIEEKSVKSGKVTEKKKTVPQQKRKSKPDPPPPGRSGQKKAVSPAPLDDQAVLLSVADMCRLLKISRATLVRMDKAGQIPGRMKLGGSVRFHRATIDTWLKSLIAPQETPGSPR